MLLDAADDLLLPEERTHFDLHLADCPDCTKLFADVRRGGAWMEMLKADPPMPPAGLVDKILASTSGDVAVHHEVMANIAHTQSLFGHSQGARIIPFRVPEPRTRWARMMHTVAQPRFAMTAAMAFFSIALSLNFAGVKLSGLRAADLKPTNLRKSFWSANGRVVRYYDNLRVVYELESRVHEMQKDSSDDDSQQRGIKQQEQQPTRQPNGQPKSYNPRWRHHREEQSVEQHPHLMQVGVPQTYRATAGNVSGEGVRA